MMKRSLFATIRAALGARSEGSRRTAPRKGRLPLTVEEMESRIVMTSAMGFAVLSTLSDSALHSTAIGDYIRDGQITRNDMIQLFKQASNQFTYLPYADAQDLITLVSNGSAVGMPDYVQNLASKVLSYSSTTTYYNWGLLNGTLPSYNSSIAVNIGSQVNNFFLGQSRPSPTVVTFNGVFPTVTTGPYQVNNLPLFAAGGPKFQDVKQGQVGDCWLMVSLAEVAYRNPSVIQNMFVDNGDGTYTVRFFDNGTPDYVTVDKFLPGGGNLYAQPQGCLWVALAEKAYAQECAYGWIGTLSPNTNSYQALNSGYAYWALSAITGNSAGMTAIVPSGLLASGPYSWSPTWAIDAAWHAGQYVVLCTTSGGPNVVPQHCYALLYDAYGSYQMFNPWGVGGVTQNGINYPGFVSGDATFVVSYFTASCQCASAMPSGSTRSMSAVPSAAAHPAGPTGETSVWHEAHSLTTPTLPTSGGDAEAALASISQGRQPHSMQRLAAVGCIFSDGPAEEDVLSCKSLRAMVAV
jgi:hypothetical protein